MLLRLLLKYDRQGVAFTVAVIFVSLSLLLLLEKLCNTSLENSLPENEWGSKSGKEHRILWRRREERKASARHIDQQLMQMPATIHVWRTLEVAIFSRVWKCLNKQWVSEKEGAAGCVYIKWEKTQQATKRGENNLKKESMWRPTQGAGDDEEQRDAVSWFMMHPNEREMPC